MTQVVNSHYALARAKIAAGAWTVDAERGLVFGVKGHPFRRQNSWGYIQIKFRHPDDYTQEVAVLAHRVLWESVHGPLDPALTINHLNGVKLDNRLRNLEAISQAENLRHAIDTGLWLPAQGEEHPTAKITADQALAIYRRSWSGESSASVAKDFPVGRSMVSNIKCGLAWSHITGHAERSGGQVCS